MPENERKNGLLLLERTNQMFTNIECNHCGCKGRFKVFRVKEMDYDGNIVGELLDGYKYTVVFDDPDKNFNVQRPERKVIVQREEGKNGSNQ